MAQASVAGAALKWQFAAAERRGHIRPAALIWPLLLSIPLPSAVPVALLLTRAVYDPSIAQALPATVEALRAWDGKQAPDEPVYAALVSDFKKVAEDNTAAFVGKRLN